MKKLYSISNKEGCVLESKFFDDDKSAVSYFKASYEPLAGCSVTSIDENQNMELVKSF
jgi:hypothetical protein